MRIFGGRETVRTIGREEMTRRHRWTLLALLAITVGE